MERAKIVVQSPAQALDASAGAITSGMAS